MPCSASPTCATSRARVGSGSTSSSPPAMRSASAASRASGCSTQRLRSTTMTTSAAPSAARPAPSVMAQRVAGLSRGTHSTPADASPRRRETAGSGRAAPCGSPCGTPRVSSSGLSARAILAAMASATLGVGDVDDLGLDARRAELGLDSERAPGGARSRVAVGGGVQLRPCAAPRPPGRGGGPRAPPATARPPPRRPGPRARGPRSRGRARSRARRGARAGGASGGRRVEAIADAPHGHEQLRVAGIGLELVAQLAHVDRHGAAVAPRAPHALEDLLAAEHLARMGRRTASAARTRAP